MCELLLLWLRTTRRLATPHNTIQNKKNEIFLLHFHSFLFLSACVRSVVPCAFFFFVVQIMKMHFAHVTQMYFTMSAHTVTRNGWMFSVEIQNICRKIVINWNRQLHAIHVDGKAIQCNIVPCVPSAYPTLPIDDCYLLCNCANCFYSIRLYRCKQLQPQ